MPHTVALAPTHVYAEMEKRNNQKLSSEENQFKREKDRERESIIQHF